MIRLARKKLREEYGSHKNNVGTRIESELTTAADTSSPVTANKKTSVTGGGRQGGRKRSAAPMPGVDDDSFLLNDENDSCAQSLTMSTGENNEKQMSKPKKKNKVDMPKAEVASAGSAKKNTSTTQTVVQAGEKVRNGAEVLVTNELSSLDVAHGSLPVLARVEVEALPNSDTHDSEF